MFTLVQSDNSHLKCLLELQNIVRVWHPASDLIIPHRYVYTETLGSDEQNILNTQSGTTGGCWWGSKNMQQY